jgi:DNA-binding protein WhiA
MVAGSLSGAGRPVHLEVAAPGDRTAQDLGTLLQVRAQGTRVVLKDGERVGELLAAVGAHQTFIAFDRGRMHRELRGMVTRSVNADRANLRRTADSASMHIAAIQRLVDSVGWEGIPEDLRDTALVRVVNPEASLSDLGRLLDPEVGKATVHRRLKRLGTLQADEASDASGHPTD